MAGRSFSNDALSRMNRLTHDAKYQVEEILRRKQQNETDGDNLDKEFERIRVERESLEKETFHFQDQFQSLDEEYVRTKHLVDDASSEQKLLMESCERKKKMIDDRIAAAQQRKSTHEAKMKDWKSAKAAHEKGWNEISYIKTLKEWRKVYAEDEENKKKLREQHSETFFKIDMEKIQAEKVKKYGTESNFVLSFASRMVSHSRRQSSVEASLKNLQESSCKGKETLRKIATERKELEGLNEKMQLRRYSSTQNRSTANPSRERASRQSKSPQRLRQIATERKELEGLNEKMQLCKNSLIKNRSTAKPLREKASSQSKSPQVQRKINEISRAKNPKLLQRQKNARSKSPQFKNFEAANLNSPPRQLNMDENSSVAVNPPSRSSTMLKTPQLKIPSFLRVRENSKIKETRSDPEPNLTYDQPSKSKQMLSSRLKQRATFDMDGRKTFSVFQDLDDDMKRGHSNLGNLEASEMDNLSFSEEGGKKSENRPTDGSSFDLDWPNINDSGSSRKNLDFSFDF